MQTTLVKADSKGRLCIRGTKKGEHYLISAEAKGWWVTPAPKIKMPELEQIVVETWEELGPAPEIDYFDEAPALASGANEGKRSDR